MDEPDQVEVPKAVSRQVNIYTTLMMMMKEYCVHSILDCQTSCHPTEREGFVLVDTEPSFKTLTMGTETRRPDFPTCRYSASLGGKDDKIWELFLDTNDFQLLSS